MANATATIHAGCCIVNDAGKAIHVPVQAHRGSEIEGVGAENHVESTVTQQVQCKRHEEGTKLKRRNNGKLRCLETPRADISSV